MQQDSTNKTRFIDRLPYKTIAAVVATGVVCSTASATAASLVTSAQIKDGTITNRDIHRGTISENRLDGALRAKISHLPQHGKDGVNGQHGVTGEHGAKGDQGDRGENGRDGADGKDGRDGTNLPADFHVSNKSVGVTINGVVFGPYADGGTQGASILYTGKAGTQARDINRLAYEAMWNNDEKNDVGVPYLRLFMENGAHVIFSPNTQPTKDTEPGVMHKWNVKDGTVRYNDDRGEGPDMSWEHFIAQHGDEAIAKIGVTVGYSAGKNETGTLRSLEVNDHSWTFGA
jgi:hypothetical protein